MDRERRTIPDGGAVIDGDRIVAVGRREDLQREYHPEERIGGKNFALLPGFINTHCHTEVSLFRGLCDEMSLMEFKKHVLTPAIPHYTPRDIYLASLVSLIELVKNGVTTVLDIGFHKNESAKAASELGTRSIVAEAMMDRVQGEAEGPTESTETALGKGLDLFKKWNGRADGRIRVWFGPFTELLATPELVERTGRLAEEYGTGIHMHLAESYETQSIIKRTYGKRIFEYLDELGILKPNLLAVHCCWLSEREVKMIKDAGVKISHCPGAEMKLSDGVTPLSLLEAEGVTVSIGTDSALCNNCNDLLREAKLASLLQRVVVPPLDPERIPAQRALEMITIDAARCSLWQDEIGSIEPGKKADLVLIDLKKPHYMPLLEKPRMNLVGNLIYAGCGSDVDTVIVGGKTIVSNRVVLTINEEAILDEFQKAAESLLERSEILLTQGDRRQQVRT
jgi:5-methylthioadenosine/S-adenosylhomocysteine deaminase